MTPLACCHMAVSFWVMVATLTGSRDVVFVAPSGAHRPCPFCRFYLFSSSFPPLPPTPPSVALISVERRLLGQRHRRRPITHEGVVVAARHVGVDRDLGAHRPLPFHMLHNPRPSILHPHVGRPLAKNSDLVVPPSCPPPPRNRSTLLTLLLPK